MPGEETKEQTSNRSDPVIYVIDRESEKTIQLGLECNTLKSVGKLRNILDSYHTREKSEFLQCLLKVDDSFETLVYDKLKPHNFAESPEYRVDLRFPNSNKMGDKEIGQLFSRVDAIRRSGVEWRLKDGLSHPPEVPSIDIVCARITRDEELFKRTLNQLKALFEITLRVKTDSVLKRAKIQLEKNKPRVTKLQCTSCNIEYTREQYQESRFCRKCNNRISFVQTA
jgi:hypothetical protein